MSIGTAPPIKFIRIRMRNHANTAADDKVIRLPQSADTKATPTLLTVLVSFSKPCCFGC
jgi:hypothetical protein